MIFHNFPIFSYPYSSIIIKFVEKCFGENKTSSIDISNRLLPQFYVEVNVRDFTIIEMCMYTLYGIPVESFLTAY